MEDGKIKAKLRDYDEFRIKKVLNGYHLHYIPEDEELLEQVEMVGTEESRYSSEAECFADFLHAINDRFGPGHSKYNPENVTIRVVPGDDTGGLSFDEFYQADLLLGMKTDDEGKELSWEEYGKVVHEKLTEWLKDDEEFRKRHNLKGHWN